MGRPRMYAWEEWFGRPTTALEQGVHYQCSQSTMVQAIRNNASKRGVLVKITDIDIGIIIEVKERDTTISHNTKITVIE